MYHKTIDENRYVRYGPTTTTKLKAPALGKEHEEFVGVNHVWRANLPKPLQVVYIPTQSKTKIKVCKIDFRRLYFLTLYIEQSFCQNKDLQYNPILYFCLACTSILISLYWNWHLVILLQKRLKNIFRVINIFKNYLFCSCSSSCIIIL